MATLTPTAMVADGAGLDLTALLAAPSATTLTFTNTGREVLFIKGTAGTETVTVDIGTTVLGQTISNFAAVTLVAAHVVMFGPFHTIDDQTGSLAGSVQVVLSTVTGMTVALISTVGVY
jgi:hypothetical protein